MPTPIINFLIKPNNVFAYSSLHLSVYHAYETGQGTVNNTQIVKKKKKKKKNNTQIVNSISTDWKIIFRFIPYKICKHKN